MSKYSFNRSVTDYTLSLIYESEACSSLDFDSGFPSAVLACASLPATEVETEGDIEGLMLPAALFDSNQGQEELERLLASKKTSVGEERGASSEGDVEVGLIIDNDYVLKQYRLPEDMASADADFTRMPTVSCFVSRSHFECPSCVDGMLSNNV